MNPVRNNILIIEDEAALADALKVNLKIKGYGVSIAGDGEEALARIRKKIPDLILSDLLLPKKDGFEVLEELKSHPKWRKVPVIIISNLDTQDSLIRARDLGVTHFFIKSQHTIAEIIGEVERCLRKGNSTRRTSQAHETRRSR